MLVKFLNSDSTVSTAIAGSYFKGDGWTGAYYDSETGQLVFESEDGLGFITGDLRVATGGASVVEWTTVLNKPTSFPPSAHTHTWAEVQDKPTEFTPISHNHTISEVTGLQSTIDNKADKSEILTQQQFRDSVAAMFQSGTHTNVSINYDSVAGTINLSAVGGGGASVSEEEVQDWVGNLITQGTGISVVYDDVGNVLSIGLSGVSFTSADKAKLDGIAENATANSTDSQLRDRSTHTGTQDISTINGLQTELDGKQPTTSFKTINGTVITGTGDIIIPAGPQGPQGEVGPQGIQGPKGDKGDTGDQGPQGPKGNDGTGVTILGSFTNESELPATGNLGDAYLINGNMYVWNGTAYENLGSIQGPQGLKGDTGDIGPQGVKGDPGIQGPEGPKGDTGDTGPQGIPGLKGDTGDTGPQGLKGDKGDKGDVGNQGIQGVKGDTGNVGPQGPQGDNISVTIFTDEAAFDAYIPASTRDWAILNN